VVRPYRGLALAEPEVEPPLEDFFAGVEDGFLLLAGELDLPADVPGCGVLATEEGLGELVDPEGAALPEDEWEYAGTSDDGLELKAAMMSGGIWLALSLSCCSAPVT
jgi:hypothetical protein